MYLKAITMTGKKTANPHENTHTRVIPVEDYQAIGQGEDINISATTPKGVNYNFNVSAKAPADGSCHVVYIMSDIGKTIEKIIPKR